MKKILCVAAFVVVLLVLLRWARGSFFEGFGSGSGTDSFTLYYADWCPHCKAVKPVFQSWSEQKSITVKSKTVFLNMVEADTQPDVVAKNNVKGFPTFMLQRADGSTKEFNGERTPEGWKSWLEANL
jgi:protein disulfide-isomerase A1